MGIKEDENEITRIGYIYNIPYKKKTKKQYNIIIKRDNCVSVSRRSV